MKPTENSRKNYFRSLSLLIFTLLLSGISCFAQNQTNSLMTVVVDYQFFEGGRHPYQIVTISSLEKESEIIYLINDGLLERRPKFFQDKTYKIGKLKTRFDNTMLLRELERFKTDGWVLKDHNFSISNFSPETEYSNSRSATFISYFIFEK
ncbi:MAG: hypothetical protein AAFQ94_02410 [Bacteroidota bacterium]